MRKIILLLTIASAVFSGCDKYDDSSIKSDINDLKQRVAALEQQCKMNNGKEPTKQKVASMLFNWKQKKLIEKRENSYLKIKK